MEYAKVNKRIVFAEICRWNAWWPVESSGLQRKLKTSMYQTMKYLNELIKDGLIVREYEGLWSDAYEMPIPVVWYFVTDKGKATEMYHRARELSDYIERGEMIVADGLQAWKFMIDEVELTTIRKDGE